MHNNLATPLVFDRLQYAKTEGKAWGTFGAGTHLGGGDMSAFVSLSATLLERSLRLPLAVQLLGNAHKESDHMAMIAVVH